MSASGLAAIVVLVWVGVMVAVLRLHRAQSTLLQLINGMDAFARKEHR